jgi:5'-nucleotidase
LRRSRLSLVVVLALTTSAAVVVLPTAASASAGDVVQLIAMNDFHGRISPQSGSDGTLLTDTPGPGADGVFGNADDGPQQVGGAANIATTLAALRADFAADGGAPGASMFVGAGDLVSASPFNSSVFKDEPTIEVLNALGLDYSSVGNHEFDRGQDELYRISAATDNTFSDDVTACQGVSEAAGTGCFTDSTNSPFAGTDFPYLAANVTTAGPGNTQVPILPPYEIHADARGNRVGLIGVVTDETPGIVSPDGITGLTFGDEATAINKYASELQGKGVQAIAVMVHEGGSQTAVTGPSYDTCAGSLARTPIAGINAVASSAVDVIISAHTHIAYNCTLTDPAGHPRLVTQAGLYGKALTDIRLTLDGTGDVDRSATYSATNVPVLRTSPDPTVQAIVTYWENRSAVEGAQVVGNQTGDLDRGYRVGKEARDLESSLGNLVADAQRASVAGAQVAFMNPGGLRADINCASSGPHDPAGSINYAETFGVQPFGNTVNTVRLTGQGIHDVLEQQWAVRSGTANFLQLSVSGLTYTFDPDRTSDRIDPASILVGGRPLDLTASYLVVANSFLTSGGDSFGAFVSGRAAGSTAVTGPNDVDVFNEYLEAQNGPVTPPALDRARSLSTDPTKQFNDDGSGRTPCNAAAATASMSKATPTRGEQVTVTGSLFEPVEQITATLADGRVLGSAKADGTGAVSIVFRVPANLPAGQQTVTLTGASGEKASTTFALGTVGSDVKTVVRAIITKLLAWLRGR